MTICEVCGMVVPEGNAFCTSCGAGLVTTAPVKKTVAGGTAGGEAGEFLSWERKIPLITNPYLVLQCMAIPFGTGVFLGLIFWLITGARDMLLLFGVLGGLLAVLFLFVMLVLQIVTGGGLLTTFFISSEGVAHRAGSTTGTLNRAATAGSVLTGSMGGTGAGLLAMSQECNRLEWNNIRYISVYPAVRSLVFRSPMLISPVVLYCTEENFSRVLTMAGAYARADAARGLKS